MGGYIIPNVSKEQIAQAKQIDLLSYLKAYEPYELKRSGVNEYRTVSHNSLVISNGKWHWCSQGFGGTTALDYLIHVRDMNFVDAVQTLLDKRAPPVLPSQPVKSKIKKPFVLPKANNCGFHAIAYLQCRGIDNEIISRCIKNGSFYESAKYHNCVFIGYDSNNEARFAWLRGITSDFQQDIESSDKRYGFVFPSSNPQNCYLYVAESPIDVLSVATLLKMKTDTWDQYSYLSLGGTSQLALLQYLKDHPNIDHIKLCLDNDKAGLNAMNKIKVAICDDDVLFNRVRMITIEPSPIGKDYNDALLAILNEKKKHDHSSRRHAAISL